jgi:hypothetical protein
MFPSSGNNWVIFSPSTDLAAEGKRKEGEKSCEKKEMKIWKCWKR